MSRSRVRSRAFQILALGDCACARSADAARCRRAPPRRGQGGLTEGKMCASRVEGGGWEQPGFRGKGGRGTEERGGREGPGQEETPRGGGKKGGGGGAGQRRLERRDAEATQRGGGSGPQRGRGPG